MAPTVSVIIPCHNAAEFVGATIESILAQEGEPAEIILSDDASTDRSAEIGVSYGARVRVIRGERKAGGSHARNLGIAQSTGRYLMFLDADDLLGPGALVALAQALEAERDPAAIAACPWRTLYPAYGGGWEERPAICPWTPPYDDLLRSWMRGWYIPACSFLWSRSALELAGGWDEDQIFNSDGELMKRALLRGVRIIRTASGLSLYRRFNWTRVSLSTAYTNEGYLPSHMRIWERLERELAAAGRLGDYRVELGRAYHALARNFFEARPDHARECARRALRLAGRKSYNGSVPHVIACNMVGLERKERFAATLRRLRLLSGR